MQGLLRWCSLHISFLLLVRTATAQPTIAVDTLVAGPVIHRPVAIAFMPGGGGKFFFTEKDSGRIRLFDEMLLDPPVFARLAVTGGNNEQGLLGIAVHPSYPDSTFVFVYFTRDGDRANIVVRLRDSSGTGIAPETLLVIPRLNAATNHNGGNLHFGPDEKLYVTVGEYAVPSNAQDTSGTNVRGKILRLNPDGSVPSDNPIPGNPLWSYGHRNSFDFTFDHASGIMYCTENGPSCNDEVNRVPPGGNLGWPVDGNCTYSGDPQYVKPLLLFPGSPLPALTGIVVYRGSSFPRLRGRLLFTGNSVPILWSAALAPGGDSVVTGSLDTLFTYGSGFADVEEGPDGSLTLTNGPYSSNRIFRLRPVAPHFLSSSPDTARQGVEYVYTPHCGGTPPEISIVTGPADMVVDTLTWSVRWTPTNAEALQGMHPVILRASNGAGSVEQSFSITVANVNDPPLSFALLLPPDNTIVSASGSDPVITFSWQQAADPDLDTVQCRVEIDTTATFSSPAFRVLGVTLADTLRAVLSRQSRSYVWRVIASDGRLLTPGTPASRRLSISFVIPVEPEKPAHAGPSLEQNFPNPFNPLTSIKYTLPQGGRVRLAVYNLLGQEVAVVFDGLQSEGAHEMEFTNADLPSGIYFYRLQAPGIMETKKMVIAK
jgi:glucose/arabinose dehydrogenase